MTNNLKMIHNNMKNCSCLSSYIKLGLVRPMKALNHKEPNIMESFSLNTLNTQI